MTLSCAAEALVCPVKCGFVKIALLCAGGWKLLARGLPGSLLPSSLAPNSMLEAQLCNEGSRGCPAMEAPWGLPRLWEGAAMEPFLLTPSTQCVLPLSQLLEAGTPPQTATCHGLSFNEGS